MKTPSTDLFQLIKSLTPQEKKYFKQFSENYSQKRENAYILLFDAIAAQEEYDESEIKKIFGKHDFVKQLSVAKNYLYDKILDSLISMNNDSDENLHLKKLINQFEVLIKKNLLLAALTACERAEKKALENGNLTLLPHVVRQKNLILSRVEKKFVANDFVGNAEEALHHSRVLENYLEYELLNLKANLIFADKRLGSDSALLEELKVIMAHPLFAHESKALSHKAWYYFSRTKYRYFYIIDEKEKCYALLKESILYLEQRESESHEWQISIFRLYADLMELSFNLRRYEECPFVLGKYRQFMEWKFRPERAIRDEYFVSTLQYHAETGKNIDVAIRTWEEGQIWWAKEKDKMEILVHHRGFFNAIKLYFLKQDWSKAILTFNDLLAAKKLNTFEAPARIYWLMIQYEIDNMEILKNQAFNVHEWFKKNNLITPMGKSIIVFFEKISSARDRHESHDKFIGLKHSIQKLKEADNSKNYLVYIDLENWVESKIENITMLEVVNRKAISI